MATTLLVESRRQKGEMLKEERASGREMLQALRLVESECRNNRAVLEVLRTSRPPEQWYPPAISMDKTAWEKYKSTVALHPDPLLWQRLDYYQASLASAEKTKVQPNDDPEKLRGYIDRDFELADDVVKRLQAALAELSTS